MTRRRHLPGKVLVRLAAGLELLDLPAHRDVRTRVAEARPALDRGGALDRCIHRHSGALRASHAFTTRQNVANPGRRHLGWDALEHELGLSRTFRVDVHPMVHVPSLVADLAALSGVEMASPLFLAQTPFATRSQSEEPDLDLDGSRAMIGAGAALDLESGDSALIVALIDSGVSTHHPELFHRLRPGLNTVSSADLEPGLELLSQARPRGQDVADDQGHGTAVAGILGANGLDVAPGLAGEAQILPIRALCGARVPGEAHATAIGSLADIDSGFKTAIDLGARVLNLSFGTAQSDLDPTDPVPHVQVVRYALARECVLVSAAGNSGKDEAFFPAALPGVIAVGAVGPSRRRSRFSTGGAHVALCAPGEGIRVAALEGYGRLSGTSFSAPMVAGACALMLAHAARRSTPLSAGQVRDLLRQSAASFAAGDPRTTATTCGAGILDVPAALRAVEEECRLEAA